MVRSATERTAAEQHTLATRVDWLRAHADAVAELEPALRDATAELVARAREHLEHAAAELVAGGRSLRRRHIGDEAPGSTAELVALIADVAVGLPKRHAARCRVELPKASASEIVIMSDLVGEGLTHEQLLHVLEGGHLLVPGLDLVDSWSVLDGVKPRTSSHYHPRDDVPPGPRWIERTRTRLADAKAKPMYGEQYGLKGKFVHEVLFGPGPQVTTFVQLERAAPSKLRLAEHIGDWVEYRATHRNQGPYGSTVETDAHPMRAPAAAAVDASVQLADIAQQLSDEPPLVIVVRRGSDVDATDRSVAAAAGLLAEAADALGAAGDDAP